MAMPALKFEPEDFVEERTVMLEADVKHIRSDVSELKVDGRRLNDKIDSMSQQQGGKIDALNEKIDEVDQRLNTKIDGVERRLSDKIDALSDKIDAVDQRQSEKNDSVKDSLSKLALSMEKSFADLRVGRAMDRVWWLLMLAAMLGIMARGFKWI